MYFDEDNNYFEDMFDIETNKYNNFDIDIGSINFNRNDQLTNIEDGFNKGNMFNNLYSKYKNHVYKLKVSNKKDELLYTLQMHEFALKDLCLYLDTHPNDESILLEFNKISKKLNDVKEKYQRLYGPLTYCETLNTGSFDWINNPWPWDKGGK